MTRLKKLKRPPRITSSAAVGGRAEGEGPLGGCFAYIDPSDRFGMDTWEQSEAESQALALNFALAAKEAGRIAPEAVIAGDLLNQCASSSYGLMNSGLPFLGVFGACSTSAEGLLIASLLLETGLYRRLAVVSSSHFCSAERQFRSPVEYGGQRAPTAQWTVTGSGAFILDAVDAGGAYITEVLIGKIVDAGTKDPANMGAAMAPAALDTFLSYFDESGSQPGDFDLILTGDLGREGSKLLRALARESGRDLSNHNDCGLMIYDRKKQDVHAGGSGCGCAATVLAGHVLPAVRRGEIRNMLFAATGALMSADAVKQGLTIPSIAHLLRIEFRKEQ